jgi:hypothetical protein
MRCLIHGGYGRHGMWHAQQRLERWILIGKPEGKKLLKRPRQRWEDIKMPLMVTG